jgi:FtsH-binding integral membrane protein
MTAMGMDDEFDPEELAEDTADRAYKRVVRGKTARLLAVTGLTVAFLAGDYVFGVMALWLVPRVLSWVLAAFMAVEFYGMAEVSVRSRREQRRQDAGLSQGERNLAFLDRQHERPPTVLWWQAGTRSPRLWLGLIIRAAYSACAGLVLVTSFGAAAGTVAAVAFTAGVLVMRTGLGPAMRGAVAALAFADPRPPRDTPEI